MAIISIDSLAEISTAGDEDVLLISTSSGAKKIKASAVGGGGGGAEDFIISATLTFNGSPVLTSQTTISDIVAANTAGKNIKLEIAAPLGVYFGTLMYLLGVSDNDPEAGFFVYLDDFGKVVCNNSGWSIS